MPPMRLLALALFGLVLIPSPAQASGLGCGELMLVLMNLRASHYKTPDIDTTIERRTAKQFTQLIDPSRTMLLEKEAKALDQRVTELFSSLRKGQCPLLDEISKHVKSRVAEDLEIVKALAKDYVLDEKAALLLDPDKRGFPLTEADRRALVQTSFHFQVASLIRNSPSKQKAAERVVHRYERAQKRAEERLSPGGLAELFAEAFASALDPHTSYMSKDVLEDFRIGMQLSLEGIGAALRQEDGLTYIESLVAGGQAEKTGRLKPKDKILAVAQAKDEPVSVVDMDLRDVVKLIRGKKGTKVTLSVLREGPPRRQFDVTIIRDKIDIKDQAAKLTVEERKVGKRLLKLGVIDLPSFYGGQEGGRSCSKDVAALLEEAKQKGVDGILIDLSKNGGGLLSEAVAIAGLFVAEGNMVAARDRGDVHVLEDPDDEVVWAGPVAILVSPLSASGSEILAGALKDYDRALIVGSRQSFGKGSVQTLAPLPGALGAIKVTTGLYFLPGGGSTQLRGIGADVLIPSIWDRLDMGESSLDYPLPHESIEPFLSKEAHAEGCCDHWMPVSKKLIDKLSAQAKARLDQNAQFKELVAENEKAKKKNDDPVKISELLEEDKESKDGKDEEEDEGDRFEKLTLGASLDVLADLTAAVEPTPRMCGGKRCR